MKIAGIIAEYNPFHNGHLFHLSKTRELLHADYCIVVMSGDFVQRGTPALLEKHIRAEMALSQGADLVLELPVEYSTGSAEFFAQGAVRILDGLGVVTHLSFGSEAGELPFFQVVSQILIQEPADYQEMLRTCLKEGLSFPAARSAALHAYFQRHAFHLPFSLEELDQFLRTPNNILGVEYCKALSQCHSSMTPFTIRREGSSYHETRLDHLYCSASAIRRHLKTGGSVELLEEKMPARSFSLMMDAVEKGATVDMDDFSLLLKYCLMNETAVTLMQYGDISQELARRIYHRLNSFESFHQFSTLLKTRELTQTRINRGLLHTILKLREHPPITYARILGMRKDAAPLLTEIKKAGTLPLVSKLSQTDYQKDSHVTQMVSENVFASNLWQSVSCQKSGSPFVHELEKPIVIL